MFLRTRAGEELLSFLRSGFNNALINLTKGDKLNLEGLLAQIKVYKDLYGKLMNVSSEIEVLEELTINK